ncbi:class I adenylate-forming enzyme family protein [Nocardioides pelophilus]|uniref:class I adenylate-forming enzyme family protein n=1 Tax=Nocardioides pelophilus TaxID=2172019 RepID=UPI00160328A1|nr:class I adenylate-forming enzyme family protein [Nocardioides pelophilus]
MTYDIAERRTALQERFSTWTPRTLDAWLDVCAAQFPERDLVVTDERVLSYAEVAAESRCLADGLATLGVRKGDHVGLLMANHAEFVTMKFAIARAGAVAIPFNFLYRIDELRYVLKQSDCTVLITNAGFQNLDHAGMLDKIVPGWDTPDFPERPPAGDRAPDALRHVVLVERPGDAPRPGAFTGTALAKLGEQHPGSADPGHRPDDISDLLYTSGSTGSPKGVQVTHDAVLRTGYASALTRAYEDGRRILFSLPCYHMFGYVEGLLSATYVGGAVIMLPSFTAEAYLGAVEKHRATDMLCVPTMAVAMVESTSRHEADLSSLRAILCGSAPAPVWLWEQVERDFGVSEIVTGYGMTECGGAMTLSLPEDELALTSTTVGRPKLAGSAGVPGSEHGATGLAALCVYRTVDPLSGEVLPDGTAGELTSSGPTTMLGYHAKPEETAAALHAGPDGTVWLHSGDLGRVREDGYLVLTGRSKEVYKSGGELVMPKEVEEVLGAHPGISQVYAVGVVDDRWGEIGCAVVVRAPGPDGDGLDAEGVIAYAKEHLARFKVPKRVEFLDSLKLPTTATGKVQKFRLVELVAQPAPLEGERR